MPVELTNEQWRVVITAVIRLPWEIANPIILEIAKQTNVNNTKMQETSAAQGEVDTRQ